MTDTAPADTTDTGTATGEAVEPEAAEDPTDWKAEAEKWRDLSRKHEQRAKANSTAATELEKFRQSSMTEAEKAVSKARQEARDETLAEVASDRASDAIRLALAGRMDDEAVDVLIEGLNLRAYVTDDGQVDKPKIAKFVDGIAPAREERSGFPDLGQGARGGASQALNGDPLLRDLKSKLGIC